MQKLSSSLSIKTTQMLTQTRLAVTAKFFAITLSVLALYTQDLGIVFSNALIDESSFHVLAIPFLFAYLLYRKRKMAHASLSLDGANPQAFQRYFNVIAGGLLCAAAILTYWFGSYTFTPVEYHMLTLPAFVAGLILILFNLQVFKQLLFPIGFLFFLTPPPSEFLYSVGSFLSNLSASASNSLANLFGLVSTLSSSYGNPVITLSRPDASLMSFSVDVACSGIYSLIGFFIFALFIAYITRGQLRNKFAVLFLGIPLIIALNIIRITSILFIGYYYGDQLALQVFHTVGATVLMFIGTLLLLAVTEKFFKSKASKTCSTCQKANFVSPEISCLDCGRLFHYPKTKLTRVDFAKIVAIALLVIVLVSIQVPVFALTEGPAQVIIQTPSGEQGNTQVLPTIEGYTLNYVYRDKAFEELSGEDASLVYAYGSLDSSRRTVWVAVELARTTSSLHRWETCLINWPLSQGQQLTVNQLDLRDIQTQDNPHMLARYFAFQYRSTNQTQVVLYWYQTATFTLNGTSETKHVKMSLVSYPSASENWSETEKQLLPIAEAINNYWQPIQTWTSVALAISQNGLILSIAATVTLGVLVLYRAFLGRQERYMLLRLYGKLPSQDILLLKAVDNSEQLGLASTNSIAQEYGKLSGATADLSWVIEKLGQAERNGLLTQKLTNNADQPEFKWRNQVPKPSFLLKWLKR
jgi:exosortase/archaeosortase family protein